MMRVYVDYLDEVYRALEDRIDAAEKKRDRKVLADVLLNVIEPMMLQRDHEEYHQARLAGPWDVYQPNRTD